MKRKKIYIQYIKRVREIYKEKKISRACGVTISLHGLKTNTFHDVRCLLENTYLREVKIILFFFCTLYTTEKVVIKLM